ncbi:MAG: hypothetical protein ACK5LK_10610 [Chthoniobacterales bacterium]
MLLGKKKPLPLTLVRNFCVTAFSILSFAGCANGFSDSLSSADRAENSSPAAADDREKPPPSASQLQQRVMDFSDHYVATVWQALDAYIATEPDVARQVQAQRLKVALSAASMTIAASRDPRAGLLDMEVFVSAGKWAAEHYWIPEVLGDKAADLQDVYAELESEIREEVDRQLSPAQRSDLRALITEWKKNNPLPREVTGIRLRNLEGVVLSDFQETASVRGLLASIKKVLGKVDQSLLYGERMMFYIERMPFLLEQQADLTVNRVAERFPIATVNPDFDQWISFAETLPQQVGDLFSSQQEAAGDLLPDLQALLGSVERILLSVQHTAATADALASKAEKIPLASEDYITAIERTDASLEKLNTLLDGLNTLLSEENSIAVQQQVNHIDQVFEDRIEHTMNALFLRVAALIAFFLIGIFVVLVTTRFLFRRPSSNANP